MQRLVLDYIRRHPLSLSFVLVLGLIWGGTAPESPDFVRYILLVQMALVGYYGLLLDLPRGYLRVTGMLPICSQQIVKFLWFEGVCLGPCLACLAYWIGALGVVLVGAFIGTPQGPELQSFLLIGQLVICMSAIGWSSFAIAGDPTRKNCSRGLSAWVFLLLMILPFLIPEGLWKALYEMAPFTTIPVIVIAWALSYLASPLILTSGVSLSWPSSPRKARGKSGTHTIVFPTRWTALLRALVNPLLNSSLAVGIGMAGWFGIMVFYIPSNRSAQFMDSFGVTMMPMVIFLILMFGAGSTGILRGLRVLPVSTSRQAWVMTLLPLETWIAPWFVLMLLATVWGNWTALLRMLPSLILLAGVSSLFLALVFSCERLMLIYFGAIAVWVLVLFANQAVLLGRSSWVVCLPVAVASLGVAYRINRDSLRRRSTVYRPRFVFAQFASQSTRWQSGG